MAQKKKSFFESLFSFKMPESRKKLTKKFKDASKKKSSQSLESAKKSVNKQISESRKKNFGTKKSGPPSSDKRLKDVVKKLVPSAIGDTNKPTAKPKKKPNIAKLKYGMGQADSMSKAKTKQGPPKPPASIKSKIKSESKLDSKGNYKGTNIKPTKLQLSRMKKSKKNTMSNITGSEMMKKKKDDGKAPMYESKGTKGGVKMKMAKGYSAGGQVFTGR